MSYENQADFMRDIIPHAQRVGAQLGIDPRLIIAQAIQETGWGKKVKGNNYFGIKSHGKKGGQIIDTHEIINGKKVKVKDKFRTYKDIGESVEDYGNFLVSNPRYDSVLKAKDLPTQINAINNSGYATDPNYGSALSNIIKGKTFTKNYSNPIVDMEEVIQQDMNQQAVPQPKSFNQAFGEARQQQGSGGTFEWNGNSYSTNMANEVPAVAEPMFPREEFVPTVPPRVTSTADSRINVPPFEGLEIPELEFNNGTNSVPGYNRGTVMIDPNDPDKLLAREALYNVNRFQDSLAPPMPVQLERPFLDYDIAQDDLAFAQPIPQANSNDSTFTKPVDGSMRFALNTATSLDNRYPIPLTQRQIDTRANRYARSTADGSYGDPQAGYSQQPVPMVVNATPPGYAAGPIGTTIDAVPPGYNARPVGTTIDAVPQVKNNVNYTEYTTQTMTQQEAESILRDPNASEESKLNARKFFSGNFIVPSEIDNSVMTEEKAYSILQDPNANPLDITKAQQFFGGIKPSEGRGDGNIEVAARKSLVPEIKETNTNTETKNDDTATLEDGVTEIDLTSKKQSEINKGTPNSVKEQVGSMLQNFFGLETSDLSRAVGFYLASRAAGYSHQGSMRWAGNTVLAQSESKRKEKLAADVRQEGYDREDARFKQVDKIALSKIAATLAGNKATNESNIAKAYETFRKGAASESAALYGSGEETRLKNIPSDENISRSAVSWGMANGYDLSDASTANNFGILYGRALQSMQQEATRNPDKKIGTLEGFLALEQAKAWTGGVDSLWVLNPEEEDQNKFKYVGSQYIQELQDPLKKKANETGKTGNAIISELALVWNKLPADKKKEYGNAKGRNGFYLFVKKELG